MSRHKCSKDLYKAFLQVSSVRYSGLALSDVSPFNISHDGISRWLKDRSFTPKDIWSVAKSVIDTNEESLLIADDSILSKVHSKKIDLVNYQLMLRSKLYFLYFFRNQQYLLICILLITSLLIYIFVYSIYKSKVSVINVSKTEIPSFLDN